MAFPDTVRQCPQYGHVVRQRPDAQATQVPGVRTKLALNNSRDSGRLQRWCLNEYCAAALASSCVSFRHASDGRSSRPTLSSPSSLPSPAPTSPLTSSAAPWRTASTTSSPSPRASPPTRSYDASASTSRSCAPSPSPPASAKSVVAADEAALRSPRRTHRRQQQDGVRRSPRRHAAAAWPDYASTMSRRSTYGELTDSRRQRRPCRRPEHPERALGHPRRQVRAARRTP